MDRFELMQYCVDYISYLPTEQLEAMKAIIDAKIELYDDKEDKEIGLFENED